MAPQHLTLECSTLEQLLSKFAQSTREQLYTRVPGSTWNSLTSVFLVSKTDITLYNNEIELYNILTEQFEEFDIDDQSFGSFLYDNLFANSNNIIQDEEKKDTMKNFNFDFGPCTNDNVRMSMYGLAVQNNAGIWVSYNNGQVVDVDIFNFDGRKFMYKMPVAISDIKPGDVVIHNRVPMFVTAVENGNISAVDVRAGEAKTIIPTTNMFNFNFVTKIVSMLDTFSAAPTAEQPFGNMLPFMMMSDNDNIDPMMMFMMMNGGKMDMSNPMMLYLMMNKNNDSSDWLLPFMMMNKF